jgi:8-oxo-dGTP pyrophosphatase MutT (NUDIX family)
VAVVARVLPRALAPARIVIIKQYRPPIGVYCLELPAGLIDAGESAGEAALRELAEETGYSGRLVGSTPECFSDPGMSNANMQVALVEVDLATPENAAARAAPEDGEFIEVELAPWEGLLEWLLERKERDGAGIDARLLSYALGLHHGAAAAGRGADADARRAGAGGFGSPVMPMLDAALPSLSSASSSSAGPAGGAAAGRAWRGGGAFRALARAAGDGKFVAGMVAATLLSLLLRRS